MHDLEDVPPLSVVPGRYTTVAEAKRARATIAGRLKPVLDRLLQGRDASIDLQNDPLSFVHRFDTPLDQEIVGLLASSLAYGNVSAIKASVSRVLDTFGASPTDAIAASHVESFDDSLSSFVHRWTKGRDVASLLRGASKVIEGHGSLGRCFEKAFFEQGSLRSAVLSFSRAIVGETPSRGLRFLLPDGTKGGACKRLHLYLRWMVRASDGVDLGLWRVPTSALLMPLDTHTSRLCRVVGLTTRSDTSWRTAEEVTWFLRGLDPKDPVKYDFALSHLGISKSCRHRPDDVLCPECLLLGVCDIFAEAVRAKRGR